MVGVKRYEDRQRHIDFTQGKLILRLEKTERGSRKAETSLTNPLNLMRIMPTQGSEESERFKPCEFVRMAFLL